MIMIISGAALTLIAVLLVVFGFKRTPTNLRGYYGVIYYGFLGVCGVAGILLVLGGFGLLE